MCVCVCVHARMRGRKKGQRRLPWISVTEKRFSFVAGMNFVQLLISIFQVDWRLAWIVAARASVSK